MPKTKVKPESIERALVLHELGWSNYKIADDFSVSESTIRRWLKKARDPEFAGEMETARAENRKKWADTAWETVIGLNEAIREYTKGIKLETLKQAKDAATVLGIYMDKINVVETRMKVKGGPEKPAVNIQILPPDGYTTRIDENPIPVYDQPRKVHSDDNGGRGGKDLLRLPERCETLAGVPEVERCDSGIDLSEPEGLRDPDADGRTLGEDGATGSVG
jgi:hypothetical protein